jgi:antitoxin PrlF
MDAVSTDIEVGAAWRAGLRSFRAGFCHSWVKSTDLRPLEGQTTVPADIRTLVDAKPGTRLVWSAMPDGTINVRAKTSSILDMARMLKAPKFRLFRQ